MLTARQQQILQLIVQLYGQYEEPIGSKTLLQKSLLDVSPATVRNDMLALERIGYLKKAHSSSGRIPSFDGYRYYVDQLIEDQADIQMAKQDSEVIQSIFRDRHFDAMQHAQLAADILVSLTGYTAVVLGESKEQYHLSEFRLIQLSESRIVAIVLTDKGSVESDLVDLPRSLSREDLGRLTQAINQEIVGLSLLEAQQRLKLTLPLLMQRLVGFQVDFSSVITKLMRHLKGRLFNLIDGSAEMFQLLEAKQGLAVELGLGGLADVSLVTSSYQYQAQQVIIGLVGPATMPYQRVLGLMHHITHELAHY